MGALWGSLSALGIGLSDLFGRRVVAASSPLTAAAAMQLLGAFAALAAALVITGSPIGADLALGGVSGFGLATGLSCYYGGLTRSTSTVVAPTVATLSAVIPFAYTVATGHPVSGLAILGAAVAVVGLAVVAWGGASVTRVGAGLRWGLASGLAYGVGLSALVETTSASGSWPGVSQRIVAFGFLAVVARFTGQSVVPPLGVRGAAMIAGTLGGLVTVFYLLGVQADATAAVVTASMFPAFSVGIGWLFFHDHVGRIQIGGIMLVLLGVVGVVAA